MPRTAPITRRTILKTKTARRTAAKSRTRKIAATDSSSSTKNTGLFFHLGSHRPIFLFLSLFFTPCSRFGVRKIISNFMEHALFLLSFCPHFSSVVPLFRPGRCFSTLIVNLLCVRSVKNLNEIFVIPFLKKYGKIYPAALLKPHTKAKVNQHKPKRGGSDPCAL